MMQFVGVQWPNDPTSLRIERQGLRSSLSHIAEGE
jgi:hypothetical protein